MSSERGRFCCGHALLCTFYFLYGLIFASVLSLSIFYLIFRPRNILFTMDGVSLTQFDLVPTSSSEATLHYNLKLNVSVRNPNRKVSVYYERIRAIASYGGGEKFATLAMNSTPFYQGRENVTVLSPVFAGKNRVLFGKEEIERYNWDRSKGIFRLDVKFDIRMRLRYGKIKTGHLKPPMVECVFDVSLSSNINKDFNNSMVKSYGCGHVLTSLMLPKD